MLYLAIIVIVSNHMQKEVLLMNIYDIVLKDNKGNEVTLKDYEGKLVLIVNTASKCGFTPQYDGLEQLYKKYQDKGFVILGFPSNQFLQQEPGADNEILEFCRTNYGVTFPLFAKSDVRGEDANPLFKYLIKETPFKGFEIEKESGRHIQDVVKRHYPESLEDDEVKWNFTKFLVGRNGKTIRRFEPTTTPEELDSVIEATL